MPENKSFPAWLSSAVHQNTTQLLQLQRSPAHRGAVAGSDSSHGKHPSIAGIAPETTWRVPGKQPALRLNIYSCSTVSTNYCILFCHFSPHVNSLSSEATWKQRGRDGEMCGKAGPGSPLTGVSRSKLLWQVFLTPRWHDSSAKAQRVTHIPPRGFQSPGGQDLDTATGMLSPFPAAQERCEAAPMRSPPRPAPAGPAPRDARGWWVQKRSSPCSPSPRVPQPPQTQATNSI